jgi:hypothetical protein
MKWRVVKRKKQNSASVARRRRQAQGAGAQSGGQRNRDKGKSVTEQPLISVNGEPLHLWLSLQHEGAVSPHLEIEPEGEAPEQWYPEELPAQMSKKRPRIAVLDHAQRLRTELF